MTCDLISVVVTVDSNWTFRVKEIVSISRIARSTFCICICCFVSRMGSWDSLRSYLRLEFCFWYFHDWLNWQLNRINRFLFNMVLLYQRFLPTWLNKGLLLLFHHFNKFLGFSFKNAFRLLDLHLLLFSRLRLRRLQMHCFWKEHIVPPRAKIEDLSRISFFLSWSFWNWLIFRELWAVSRRILRTNLFWLHCVPLNFASGLWFESLLFVQRRPCLLWKISRRIQIDKLGKVKGRCNVEKSCRGFWGV